MENKENPNDACYMCKHVGEMNKQGRITCNIGMIEDEAEPYHWCHRFERKN